MNILTKQSLSSLKQWYTDARENGAIILIDKDISWTSFDIVAKLRRIVGIKKIGHAGTLDPLATGLLIVCIGRQATKLISTYQNSNKAYIATIKLGASTASFDAETPETVFADIPSDLSETTIKEVLNSFIGHTKQIPPMYSALKKNGVPLYRSARKGIQEEIEARDIYIDYISLDAFDGTHITITVQCSKGTYIRSLASDIADKVGTVGYLTSLRRISSGDFSVNEAVNIREFEQAMHMMQLEEFQSSQIVVE
jgi:tRNA pseudouridine55 synthase